MDDSDKVFLAFEGACTQDGCSAETEIVSVGGTVEFHQNFSFIGEHPLEKWRDGDYEIGEVAFRCTEGHEFSIFALKGGNWAT